MTEKERRNKMNISAYNARLLLEYFDKRYVNLPRPVIDTDICVSYTWVQKLKCGKVRKLTIETRNGGYNYTISEDTSPIGAGAFQDYQHSKGVLLDVVRRFFDLRCPD